ncbi:MAG: F0F1 ATP synthase subunit A [Alphaproteobacteria bacterium]|nr:F0F1 ATP synthase subunit A [Alphaproteobacteria bacterium]
MHDPLHQFEIYPLLKITLLGYDVSFTNASLFMVIATMVLCGFFLIGKRELVPSYIQYIQEISLNFINNLVKNSLGSEGLVFAPYIFCLFLFIFAGNYIGLIPYSFTFTSHIIVTFSLAMIVFVVTTFIGFYKHGVHFLRLFFPKDLPLIVAPILIPIEIISYLSRPVSLSIRLFANMVAGHTMIKIFAGFALVLGSTSFFPTALLPILANSAVLVFECLIAFLQAYVFTMLTCIYLNDTLNLH